MLVNWPERFVPTQILDFPAFFGDQIQVSILREDLLDTEISGNKWRKLKYNVLQAYQLKQDTILTFGGAFSNHIAATAAAGKRFGLKTIGVIRGEEDPNNPTLKQARANGMTLYFVDRSIYREKQTDEFKAFLHDRFGSFYLVPEGGANYWGINGCMEILQPEHNEFDVIIGACGTGTMMAGILLSAKTHMEVIGIPVLKGDFMRDEITKHLEWYLMDDKATQDYLMQLTIWNGHHHGGYGKCPDTLQSFIHDFYQTTTIPLDGIYTSKVMHAISQASRNGGLKTGAKVLIIHSGGIQGNAGLNYRMQTNLPLGSH